MITMAIWAHQENTHEHVSRLCSEKTYFNFGRSFALCIVGWILCAVNIGIRVLLPSKFASADQSSFDSNAFGSSHPPKSPLLGGSAYNTL